MPSPVGVFASSLEVQITASTRWVQGMLAQKVPLVLAAGEQSVGAPGRVQFRVQRGEFGVSLVQDRLTVTTPISADVSVCKPLGPFCPTYGRCNPALISRATVPATLTPDHRIGESQVATSVVQGCSIVGLDVTQEVASQARSASAEAKRRIDAGLPDLRPALEQFFEILDQPIRVDAGSCLRIGITELAQRKPVLNSGILSSGLSVGGKLIWERPCQSPEGSGDAKAPPPLEIIGPDAPDTQIQMPVRLAWAEVGPELAQDFAHGTELPPVEAVTAKGVLVDGIPRALIRLRVQGACGDLRLVVEPWYSAADNAVHFRPLRPLDADLAGLAPSQVSALTRRLETHGRWPLPVQPSLAQGLATALFDQLGDQRPPGMNLDLQLSPLPGSVHLDAEALVAVVGLKGRVALRFE